MAAAVFCLALAIVTAADLEYRLIPNRIVLPATAIITLMTLARQAPVAAWRTRCRRCAVLLALAYPAEWGWAALLALLGRCAGRSVIPALVLATFLSAVPAIALLIRHGREGRTMGIPFGPFLAVGSVVVLFAGA
jgi:prepilin signal peptidase PulO-like enzyme (type II secretory pathway)